MHSNVRNMLSKNGVTMPLGRGAFRIYYPENLSIHLFINQFNSL